MGWRRCDPLQCRRRRSTPIKKPAAANAAGFDHGRFLFPRGMRCRRPPFDAAGGGACDAAGDRVLFSHSLLQGTSAWAKPNHGFSDCQQPVANFFSGVRASSAMRRFAIARARCAAHPHQRAHAHNQMQKRREKRDFLQCSALANERVRIASHAAYRSCGSARKRLPRHARHCARSAPFARRTSPIAQNCANFFRDSGTIDASNAHVSHARKRRTRGVRRGFG